MTYLQIADPDKPGDYLVIASRDFDPAVHTLFGAEPPAPVPTPAPPADTTAPLTAAELVTLIKGADVETLDTLEDAEEMRESGARKTVSAAIEARRSALAAA